MTSMRRRARTAALAGIAVAAACSRPEPPVGAPAQAGRIDAARLARADAEPGEWLTSGRDRGGTYFSPLREINDGNVARLGFAWQYELGTNRGLEGTPIVVDGVMYAVGNWGRVYALDAASGRELWTFVPPVDGQWGRYACCDVVSRGLAVWQGRVYTAATDGWLYALDAATGRELWKADTLIGRDRHVPYALSGAPQVAGSVVVIGNSGADFGVRGYVTAYDLASGAMKWRFFTVPHDPALGPQEGEHLDKALPTWDPDSQWDRGGGGTVWDGMAYDPDLDLLYIGTGNASPYNWKRRSPRGGDNLYLASIIAIEAGTGRMAWHYQQVPGENWDYTATMKMILTDLVVDGRRRKVLMQAPKNGFFYVLDRATGELISARPYAHVNWTKGIDPATGRPIPNPDIAYETAPKLIFPGMAGAHSWHPMSFNPQTGLVYIPAIDVPMVYVDASRRPVGEVQGSFDVIALPSEFYDPEVLAPLFGPLPPLAQLSRGSPGPAASTGALRAFDPLSGRVAWEQPGGNAWDGGVISTAGNLVIRGDAAGRLNVYEARSGRLLKQVDVGTSIMAAPATYMAQGRQYIAVMAGYGGAGGFHFTPDTAAYRYGNEGRIVAFRLDGGEVPKPASVVEAPMPEPPALTASAETVARGELLYTRYCARCHVFGRGLLPDLRRAAPATHALFDRIVLEGLYVGKGMGRFDDVLSASDVDAIHAYVIARARQAFDGQRVTRSAP
jgi:quinohemoprotein ethanol dehydrogenase